MSRSDGSNRSARYTRAFKLEAVRLGRKRRRRRPYWGAQAEPEPLGTAGRQEHAARRRRTRGECRADGAGQVARGAGADEDGARHRSKGDGVLCEGVAVKYAWSFLFRAVGPLTLICEVLGVSVSGYFEHQRKACTRATQRTGEGGMATRNCWPASAPSTPRSRTNTAGQLLRGASGAIRHWLFPVIDDYHVSRRQRV